MPNRSRLSQSEIIVRLPSDPPGDPEQTAAEIAAALNSAGIPAAVISTPAALAEFLTKQAVQILQLARQCRFPAVRAGLEKLARDCVLEAEAIEREQ